MTSENFITYGSFRELCGVIHQRFTRLNDLREEGRSDSEEYENEEKNLDRAEKDLFDSVNGDGARPFLASTLVRSAKTGLRFPHIYHGALHAGKPEDLAAFLYRHGIREITIEGCWSNFDEDLEGFFKQGWQVEGIHYLPKRWKDEYGGPRRSIHLVRPSLAAPKEDWND